MADKEQEVGVIFPFAGIDSTCEFSRQPNDTSPSGVNVRTYETLTLRSRGGSREGLTQYIPQQVNGTSALVQMLNVLVDPQDPALDQPADDAAGPGLILDPSTNNNSNRNWGRYVRIGGGGNVPNRNKPPSPTKTIKFVQVKSTVFDASAANYSVVFDIKPTSGNKIIITVMAATTPVTNGVDPTNPSVPLRVSLVQNNAGTNYTQVGGGSFFSEMQFVPSAFSTPAFYSVSSWFLDSTGILDDQTLTITTVAPADPTTPVFLLVNAAEYSNVATGAPFSSGKAFSNTDVPTWSSATMALAGTSGQMATWYAYGTSQLLNLNLRIFPSPGFTERGGFNTSLSPGLFDEIGLTSGTITPSGTSVFQAGPDIPTGPNIPFDGSFAAIGSVWKTK